MLTLILFTIIAYIVYSIFCFDAPQDLQALIAKTQKENNCSLAEAADIVSVKHVQNIGYSTRAYRGVIDMQVGFRYHKVLSGRYSESLDQVTFEIVRTTHLSHKGFFKFELICKEAETGNHIPILASVLIVPTTIFGNFYASEIALA